MQTLSETIFPRKNIRSFLSALDRFRTDRDLTIDEAVIFLAIGDLNLSVRHADVLMMRPTNMTAIAYQLDVPRETIRRKVKTLIDKGLLRVRGREIYLNDVQTWLDLGDDIGDGRPHLKAVA